MKAVTLGSSSPPHTRISSWPTSSAREEQGQDGLRSVDARRGDHHGGEAFQRGGEALQACYRDARWSQGGRLSHKGGRRAGDSYVEGRPGGDFQEFRYIG